VGLGGNTKFTLEKLVHQENSWGSEGPKEETSAEKESDISPIGRKE